MIRKTSIFNCGAILALAAWAALPAHAALLGDVNSDGATDVLDVQASVNQALGAAEPSLEADLDEVDGVNILDVQHLINTALGVGGLTQGVRGVVDCTGEAEQVRIIAVSRQGQRVHGDVDPATGEFRLLLRVRTSWALALCVMAQQQYRCLGTFEFPIGDRMSCTLPLPQLSRGEDLDLGTLLAVGHRLRVQAELRRLLGQLDEPADLTDDNDNGMPDFVEPLVERVRQGPGVPAGADIDALIELAADCITAVLEEDPTLDLTDENRNAMPDFVEPLLECLRAALEIWLPEQPSGPGLVAGQPDRSVQNIIEHVAHGVPGWLRSLERAGLVDDNEDGIPDSIEPHLSTADAATAIDSNADLTPDFAGDRDGDGVPNILDPDWTSSTDHDGDGICNADDVDNDNDGVPDYADANPLDPTVVAITPIPLGH